jgi:DNA-binding NarL/FixJ family response regulator
MPPYKPIEQRLTDKTQIDPETGCWNWTGSRDVGGYGNIRAARAHLGGKGTFQAHRVAYELHKGPIPDGMIVCHRCDNRACVNPDHLFLSDHHGNMRDMAQKARARLLTAEQVKEVVARLESGWSQGMLARAFNVSRSVIQAAIKRAASGDYGTASSSGIVPKYTKLSDNDRQKIIALLADGKDVSTIAREFNVDRKTVRNIRDAVATGRPMYGRRNPQAKLTDEIVAEAKRLYAEGHSQQAIAERLGLDQTTISRAVRR